ncbi:hypothetical protein JS81_13925 [Thermoactinomyces sp. Gus2-1]|nr:hypothetical protein JS81_13925 [Thermoactinomyces sp. Gus2-1]
MSSQRKPGAHLAESLAVPSLSRWQIIRDRGRLEKCRQKNFSFQKLQQTFRLPPRYNEWHKLNAR